MTESRTIRRTRQVEIWKKIESRTIKTRRVALWWVTESMTIRRTRQVELWRTT
jgi:hypothetical protein